MSRLSFRSLPQAELESLETPSELSELPEAQASSAQHRFERGQTLVEYALIIALVAIVVIASLYLLGPAISNTFNNIIKTL
ncbi:MAG TPA: Flp family type IVb pilin [Ktedonobacterales bacterium]|nr:Flp family type IVb pilin [Ktedonobacterales bacterium]